MDGHHLGELWLCRHGPDRNVEVRVEDLAGAGYRERFVVFREPLERDNLDLGRFLRDLDEARVADLAAKLAGNRTFLVFTAAREKLGRAEARLRGLGVLVELGPLPADLLLEGLLRLASRRRAADSGETDRFLASSGQRIVDHLKSMPRIARFVHETLADVAHGRVELAAALGRADSLEKWFLQDLAERPDGFDAWCYCLALVLCHAADRAGSVSWSHFDALRQELRRYLERQLRCSRAPRAVHTLCRESTLCDAVRAEIVQPGFPEACSIRFRHASYPDHLWRVLLGPGRALLGMLRPLLGALAQSGEPYLRTLAAQVTGRSGELDPNMLVLSAFDRDEAPLGPLFQGILASEDERYRSHCLLRLRERATGGNLVRAKLAIRSLVDIGNVDLALALAELRAVCAGKLAPLFTWESLGPSIAKLEDEGRVGAEAREVLNRVRIGNLRGFLAEALSARSLDLLDAVRYSLVGLCLNRGTLEVISALPAWTAEQDDANGSPLGPLVAVLFLQLFGVLAYLERFKVPGGEEKNRFFSPVLSGAAAPEDAATLARFLTSVYANLAAFPGAIREGLRRRWLALLKDWAQQVAGGEELRDAVIDLFRELLATGSADLRREVLRLLRHDPDFARPGSDLAALAVSAITGERRHRT